LEEHDNHGYQEGFQIDSIGEKGHQGDAANGSALLQTLLDHLGNVVKTMISPKLPNLQLSISIKLRSPEEEEGLSRVL
jgi:hypothetical protein